MRCHFSPGVDGYLNLPRLTLKKISFFLPKKSKLFAGELRKEAGNQPSTLRPLIVGFW